MTQTETNPVLSSNRYITQGLDTLLADILQSKDDYVAVDTETTGLRWTTHRAFGVAIAWDDYSVFIRNETWGVENLSKFMQDLFANTSKQFVFHNAEFDLHMIRETYGAEAPEKIIDTLRVAHLYDASANHSLKEWGTEEYGDSASFYEDRIHNYMKAYKIKDYSLVPADLMDEYAANDTVLTKGLAYKYVPLVKKEFGGLFTLEHALIPVILDMERQGIAIDLNYIDQLHSRIVKQKQKLVDSVQSLVGKPIQIGSSKQVGDYLWDRLQIKPPLTNMEFVDGRPVYKTSRSTNEKALKSIDHPTGSKFAKLVLRWRELEKIDNTYLNSYTKIHKNGRIHPRFNACGTLTGRFSGSDPNMQNIPKDDSIRRIFVPDTEFIDMDYSQLELKLMAHASGQENMIQAFNDGADLHSYTASLLMNKPIEEVDPKGRERKMAKSLNFGVIYGIGTKGLADYAGIPERDAQRYLRDYWQRYPKIRTYFRKQKRFAEDNEYIRTMFNRKVPLRDRFYASPNYAIQGTGGDIMKISMLKTWRFVKSIGGSLRNTVHDQILFDNVDKKYIPEIKELMEDFSFKMPITVDVQTSDKSWGDLDDSE